jgi:DNA polymerase III subunit delta'
MNLYSWQLYLWGQLWQAGTERIPHALLLSGPSGTGKRAFAAVLTQSLLCKRPGANYLPCGNCEACHFFGQNAHPDFRLVQPEAEDENDDADGKDKKASEFITINQIRQLRDFIWLTSHQNGRRVAMIYPAEQLNMNAANALLKMLEEPPPQTIFILVANQLSRILPTVRSRCRMIKMPMPVHDQATAWLTQENCPEPALNLALAGGAPIEALALGQSPELQAQRKHFCAALARPENADAIALAESIIKVPAPTVMRWLHTWIYDLMRAKASVEHRFHLDWSKSINNLNKKVQIIELYEFNSHLLDVKRLLNHPLNPKLFWESLFIKYFNLFI